MCNEWAIAVPIRPGGDEILLGANTHPLRSEAGGPAGLSGAVMTVVGGPDARLPPSPRRAGSGDPGAPRRGPLRPAPAPRLRRAADEPGRRADLARGAGARRPA